MIPDRSALLDDLTAAPTDGADALVCALRADRRRRTRRQAVAATAVGFVAIATAIGLLTHELPIPSPIGEPSRTPDLTQSELLDSFGDQPVALVVWPDGRQQLLAIASPPIGSTPR
jgi:hypothetical protein